MDLWTPLKFPFHSRTWCSMCEHNKVQRVVDNAPLVHWWELLHTVRCCPLIAVCSACCSNMLLGDEGQCCSWPVENHSHDSKTCWYHTCQRPTWWVPTMALQSNNYTMFACLKTAMIGYTANYFHIMSMILGLCWNNNEFVNLYVHPASMEHRGWGAASCK